MNVELDRREVLMHLQEMGYYNITPQKLEEFIKDLKKLILYDQNKKQMRLNKPQQLTEDSTSSTLPNTTDESVSPSPPPPPSTHSRHRPRPLTGGGSHGRKTDDVSCSSSESSVPPPRKVLRECSKHTVHKSQERENVPKEKPNEPEKPSKTCDCLWRRIGCKCCDEKWAKEQNIAKTAKSKENLAPPRPKSSFIRTWQLTGQPRPGSATQRSDPVALYHHYQQMWKQQKLPGETNHNDLRWTVRERMLGQQPHPRPPSQASSVSSLNRQRKRL